MFSGNFVAYYGGINGATIQGYYLRDGGSEEPWRRCLGGGFELQTKSRYAGEYQCTGTPPVCKKKTVSSFTDVVVNNTSCVFSHALEA